MKNTKLTIITLLFFCIALITSAAQSISNSNNSINDGTTITCTGDRTVVCAEGESSSGSTWKAYGDKAVIEVVEAN